VRFATLVDWPDKKKWQQLLVRTKEGCCLGWKSQTLLPFSFSCYDPKATL